MHACCLVLKRAHVPGARAPCSRHRLSTRTFALVRAHQARAAEGKAAFTVDDAVEKSDQLRLCQHAMAAAGDPADADAMTPMQRARAQPSHPRLRACMHACCLVLKRAHVPGARAPPRRVRPASVDGHTCALVCSRRPAVCLAGADKFAKACSPLSVVVELAEGAIVPLPPIDDFGLP